MHFRVSIFRVAATAFSHYLVLCKLSGKIRLRLTEQHNQPFVSRENFRKPRENELSENRYPRM
jgi:hypothetical protein